MNTIISEVALSKQQQERDGLGPTHMVGMTDVMAIAGPNGSGKSRLLRCIKEAMDAPNIRRILLDTRQTRLRQIDEFNTQLRQYPSNSDHPAVATTTKQIAACQAEISEGDAKLAGMPEIRMEPDFGVPVLLLEAQRPEVLSVAEAKQHELVYAANVMEALSNFKEAKKGAKRRIYKFSQDCVAANSTLVDPGPSDELTKSRYADLQRLLFLLLGEQLTCEVEQPAKLYGKPIDDAKLSEGQMILLQFAAALVEVNLNKPCILLLDEPETHLHPAAQIALLDALKKALPQGQIIIATHSVPLLAHIGVDRIWSMKDGVASQSNKKIQEVLTQLMGGASEIAGLRDFIDEPAHLAAVDFSFQCLMPPKTAPYSEDDPQQGQMVGGLALSWPADRPLRVVDWGAGKGRLAAALRETLAEQGTDFESRLNYFAYNPECCALDQLECLRNMALLDKASSESRFLRSEADLNDAFVHAKADAAILCNCLHEIEPKHWPATFAAIDRCLSPKGFLIMVEDLAFSVGELAFPQGFFLLGEAAMAALLGVGAVRFSTAFAPGELYKDRLVRYVVPKGVLAAVNDATVRAAIEQTRQIAMDQTSALRSTSPALADLKEAAARHHGRRHALLTQQIANACLFLRDIDPNAH